MSFIHLRQIGSNRRSGAHSCSYEEDKFLNTPGLELLGLPATPGVGLWRADRCRIECFGAARSGMLLPRVAGPSQLDRKNGRRANFLEPSPLSRGSISMCGIQGAW